MSWRCRKLVIGACLRIVLFGSLALVRPARKRDSLTLVTEWRHILAWTVGFRGPGLREVVRL